MAPRGRVAALLVCVVLAGCGRDRQAPDPPATSTTELPTSTTPLPKITGEAIPGVDTAAFHAALGRLGFTAVQPATIPEFVTTTSRRDGATVSTYGRGAADVVKVVAEADRKAAVAILVPVARSVASAGDDRKVEDWLRAELKKGPISETRPRTARQTYGGQLYDLLITGVTATLSIGDLTS